MKFSGIVLGTFASCFVVCFHVPSTLEGYPTHSTADMVIHKTISNATQTHISFNRIIFVSSLTLSFPRTAHGTASQQLLISRRSRQRSDSPQLETLTTQITAVFPRARSASPRRGERTRMPWKNLWSRLKTGWWNAREAPLLTQWQSCVFRVCLFNSVLDTETCISQKWCNSHSSALEMGNCSVQRRWTVNAEWHLVKPLYSCSS